MSDKTRRALADLVAVVAPLVDPAGSVQPFASAWEIDPQRMDGPDGEELHRRLTEAYGAAVKALEAKPRLGVIECAVTVHPPEPRIVHVPVPVEVERWLRA